MPAIDHYQRQLDRLTGQYREAKRRVQVETDALLAAQEKVKDLTEAQQILQSIAQQTQAEAHQRVASIVSRCLRSVFGDRAYALKINFVQKRGKTEAELVLERDGLEVDPRSGVGGGVVDVCSFGLRLTALLMSRPSLRRLAVLDEPFRFLSRNHHPAIRELLLLLAKELDLQIVMVTHAQGLVCGKVFELE